MTNVSSQIELAPPPVRSDPGWTPSIPELKPLSIGAVEIGFPVVQAALSGYSDWPMRLVARRLGAPYTIAEVMIDRFVLDLKNSRRTKHYLQVTDEEHPVSAQLMGSEPALFAPAAKRLVQAGFDVIDINFGCPVKSAIGGCRGGYHLSQPTTALQIVDEVRSAVPATIPVTVKMRRGIDDSSESRENFFAILDGAFDGGAAAITVHGRTVEQKYIGPSDWDFLRDVKCHAGAKVILGSGDLFDAQACLDMISYTGVDGVSVARGAIGNPWVFEQARALSAGQPAENPSLREMKRVLEMQFELCLQVYDERRSVATMRKFGIKFARLHPQHELVRNAFAAAKSAAAWHAVLNEWYDEPTID